MPESNIDIILRTKREGAAPQETVEDLEEMRGGLTNLEKAMAGTRSTVGALDRDIALFGTNIGSTTDLLSGMGISIPVTPMQGFGMALQATGEFLKSSISDYTAYVAEVDKVATYTGMASEETSRLIQMGDDLRIGTGTLELALKAMTENGLTPSILGLQDLATKYNNIKDPADKARFLNDNFGRSGAEMARMMELGAEGIQDATDAVSDYMVVTGDSLEQAEEYMLAMDEWEDTWAGFKYQIAEAVIPALTDLLNIFVASNEEVNEGGAQWMRYIPFLSQARQVYIMAKNAIDETTTEVAAQADEVDNLGNSWERTGKKTEEASQKAWGYVSLTQGANFSFGPQTQVYGGGKATGGGVEPGNIYKVGEHETELLYLNVPGTIIPTTTNGNQPIVFNYQPIISLADREEAQRVLTPFIKEALRKDA